MNEPEQNPLQEAMRFGEANEYFVEVVVAAKNGIEYDVPRVFWDDFTAAQNTIAALEAENADLQRRVDAAQGLERALEWIKTKMEVHRLHGGKTTDYAHAMRLVEDKAETALTASRKARGE